MSEILFGLFALISALLLVFVIALSIHWGNKRETGLVPYVFYPVMLSIALTAILSNRDISGNEILLTAQTVRHPVGVWFGRMTSLFVIFACGERILHRLMERETLKPMPMLLFWALFIYFLTNILSPAFLGSHTDVSHEYLYMFLAGYAALLMTPKEVDMSIVSMRNATLLFLVLSAAVAAWNPNMVFNKNYHGLIPFLSVRYAGLASHANGLGPMAVAFLLCLWRKPYAWRALNLFAWTLGLASLMLAQSKTNWIACILCFACIAYFGFREQIKERLFDYRRPQLSIIGIFCFILLCVLGMLLVMFGNLDAKLARFASSNEGFELLSFTGRDVIWQVAVQEWHKNPVFGYGLQIWDEAFRLSIGMPYATHAHSQFYQSLSSAGTVGAVGLVLYVIVLLYGAARTARASQGLSMALFVLIISRSFSEVPLSLAGFAAEALTHLLLLIIVAAYYPTADRQAVRARKVRVPGMA
ncbi:O-antigen ligase family protein [Janthinobacterium sp. FW305-129]|uniref:O-antigen ligase family protein n=1 Tax=Janthinobacterium sp. FW305-129 TaxID=2775054 RepID=UPI001E358678|nr:O-antigen ligase family protein [Janthinobacterium sp. FW305-129]MCC7596617.1 O-antigen ligase family protein [Janthinobacterium sp. FW305-129]